MNAISRELKKAINSANGKKTPVKRIAENDIGERFYVNFDGENQGTFFTEDDGRPFLICSPLAILAVTRTDEGENYGRLLRWKDPENRVHTWAMPIEFVHGDGFDLIKYLVSRGLQIGTSRKNYEKLRSYINLTPAPKTIICTSKIGWHGAAFVLPDETFGSNVEIAFQTDAPGFHKFAAAGTLDDWNEQVGKYCAGNSRLAFSVSAAFASPLLPIADLSGGGFHLRGTTSTGKTTALLVAGSVCGGSDDPHGFCEKWKATGNALESVAESHNHNLLCLDEISEIDSRQIGDVVYMLANGSGKTRMTKHLATRRSMSWQLLFLSNGEISLADKMLEAGIVTKGGQEIRAVDIPADTGKFGLFENLHGFSDGQSLSDHLRAAAKKTYGAPLREFLRRFVALDREQVKAEWRKHHEQYVQRLLPGKDYPSEVYRVAARFALVAFAGELAAHLEVLTWRKGEAAAAAETVFNSWFENRRGRGGSDAERALSQIRGFIEAHGASRFQMLAATDESLETGKIQHRAGFKRKNAEGEFDFLFLPEVFRSEVCKGFDYKFVCKVLSERRFLESNNAGEFQKTVRCGEMGLIRVYLINSTIMASEAEEKGKTLTADMNN